MKFFLLFFVTLHLFAELPLIRREEPLSLKTSVIIPCIPKHFQYIPELMDYYAGQTIPPDEVVISLSDTANMARDEIDRLKERAWPFVLNIVEHLERRSEGENRNLGTLSATGDLLLYQDADDLPHPQRIELVRYLFENYQIDHLMHAYVLDTLFQGFEQYEKESLPVCYSNRYTNCVGDRHFHNGATALLSSVADQVQWVEGFVISTDTLSNMEVYKTVRNKVFLLEPLILYRHTFSTYHGINR